VVGLQNDFRVSLGKKPIADVAQFGPELAEIVDTSVENETKAKLAVYHRLLRGWREIENA
jgi:hypothetical protein